MVNPFKSSIHDLLLPLPAVEADDAQRQDLVDLITARAERLELEAATLREQAASLSGHAGFRSATEGNPWRTGRATTS